MSLPALICNLEAVQVDQQRNFCGYEAITNIPLETISAIYSLEGDYKIYFSQSVVTTQSCLDKCCLHDCFLQSLQEHLLHHHQPLLQDLQKNQIARLHEKRKSQGSVKTRFNLVASWTHVHNLLASIACPATHGMNQPRHLFQTLHENMLLFPNVSKNFLKHSGSNEQTFFWWSRSPWCSHTSESQRTPQYKPIYLTTNQAQSCTLKTNRIWLQKLCPL